MKSNTYLDERPRPRQSGKLAVHHPFKRLSGGIRQAIGAVVSPIRLTDPTILPFGYTGVRRSHWMPVVLTKKA
jgi:hypothetical protein